MGYAKRYILQSGVLYMVVDLSQERSSIIELTKHNKIYINIYMIFVVIQTHIIIFKTNINFWFILCNFVFYLDYNN